MIHFFITMIYIEIKTSRVFVSCSFFYPKKILQISPMIQCFLTETAHEGMLRREMNFQLLRL